MMFKICCLLVVLTTLTQAAVDQDEIKMMPGLSKQPTFKQYSGYLKAGGTRKLHYWFTESMNDPASDPVVLWLNGGPGCSSDLGLLTENGPFRISADGKTVTYSKTSWNSVANMLFLEAPAGVGFSYSDDKNYTTDDNQVAQDNHLALKDFFSKFSEYSKNDFFITGESYGGIYVPTLSALVVDDTSINFKGMGIGNGLSDNKFNDNSLIYFAYYHGLIGDMAWENLNKYCCKNSTSRCYFTDAVSDPQCGPVVVGSGNGGTSIQVINFDSSQPYTKAMPGDLLHAAAYIQLTAASSIVYSSGLNIYNLYGECAGGVNNYMTQYNENTKKFKSSNFGFPFSFLEQVRTDKIKQRFIGAHNLKVDPPCIDAENVATYLNSDAVKTALHIPSGIQAWETCSGDVGNHYVRIYDDVSAQYKKVLAAGKRVLVYNGDIDMACNFLGDEWFVDGLDLQPTADREEWFYKAEDGTKQVAGFVKTFKNLSLVTVKGAGHMVPTDKPIPGLLMFESFLKDIPLA